MYSDYVYKTFDEWMENELFRSILGPNTPLCFTLVFMNLAHFIIPTNYTTHAVLSTVL